MKIEHCIYDDGEIRVAIIASDEAAAAKQLYHIAVRWLAPKGYRKGGVEVPVTNVMGGETDWFLLPHTLGVGVARTLIERKAANPGGFDATGFSRMMSWLVEMEEIFDGMCY